jgi:hypothetical protein
MLTSRVGGSSHVLFVKSYRLSGVLNEGWLHLRYKACAEFGGRLCGEHSWCATQQNLDDKITIDSQDPRL